MQVTANTRAFIEAQQYSQFILQNMYDGLLPGQFFRNVSDFGSGTTLNIKTVGTASIQDVEEDKAIVYTPIDTNTITMAITDYIGDGWHISDVLRQDGAQTEALQAMRAQESTRAIQEDFETKFLRVAAVGQLAAAINGVSHVGAVGAITPVQADAQKIIDEFARQKYAFDRANAPQQGRVAIVDAKVEYVLNTVGGLMANFDRNPQFQALLQQGFSSNHKFMFNLFGWDIYTSNRLHVLSAGDATAIGAGAAGQTANLFLNVLDDATKGVMAAWRQMPSVEGGRNKDLARDEYVTRARFGFGIQRRESLGLMLTA